MKVLKLIDSLGRGGAETVALDVCRNASRFGIDLTLVISNRGPLSDEFKKVDARVIHHYRRLPVDPFLIRKIRSTIMEHSIELVQGYSPVEGLHLYQAARGLAVKTVLSHQGLLAKHRDRLAAKFLVSRVDANIFVSHAFMDWFAKEFRLERLPNSHVIYNCSDPARLTPKSRELRSELGLDDDHLLIGMVANFPAEERKDHFTLCRALPRVFADHERAHCLFIGRVDPGGETKFRRMVEYCEEHDIPDRVHFLGSRDDIPDILAELDLFVLSSLHEGLPIAVTEAMLAGVPAVLSDIEQLREVSDNGKCAELFPVGDEKALARSISGLLSDREKRLSLAAKAREYAREHFTIDSHMKKLTELYRSLLDE